MRAFFSLVKKRSNYFPVNYVKIHSSYSMQDLRTTGSVRDIDSRVLFRILSKINEGAFEKIVNSVEIGKSP